MTPHLGQGDRQTEDQENLLIWQIKVITTMESERMHQGFGLQAGQGLSCKSSEGSVSIISAPSRESICANEMLKD